MKIPLGMAELFLRSMGAPPSFVALAKRIETEGFDAFSVARLPEDSPANARASP
jgi:hypothetical protein